MTQAVSLFQKYLGETERMIRDLFTTARKSRYLVIVMIHEYNSYPRPCVVFIDEVDALSASREGEGGR